MSNRRPIWRYVAAVLALLASAVALGVAHHGYLQRVKYNAKVGRVIDAETGEGVAGASVIVSSWTNYGATGERQGTKQDYSAIVHTDEEGRFEVSDRWRCKHWSQSRWLPTTQGIWYVLVLKPGYIMPLNDGLWRNVDADGFVQIDYYDFRRPPYALWPISPVRIDPIELERVSIVASNPNPTHRPREISLAQAIRYYKLHYEQIHRFFPEPEWTRMEKSIRADLMPRFCSVEPTHMFGIVTRRLMDEFVFDPKAFAATMAKLEPENSELALRGSRDARFPASSICEAVRQDIELEEIEARKPGWRHRDVGSGEQPCGYEMTP